MPHNLADNVSPNMPAALRPGQASPSDEVAQERLRRAKEIIAGRLVIPPMTPTPRTQAFLDRELPTFPSPPTPRALQHLIDDLNLQTLHEGDEVLIFETEQGHWVVLAAGDECAPLFRGLTNQERFHAVTIFP